VTTMLIYVLHLGTRSRLEVAFERVLDHRAVASCAVEPGLGRLRFVAPRRAGDELVEAIYLEGGLAWCSRHTLRDPYGVQVHELRRARPSQPEGCAAPA
jgi:hypothetical protein